MCVCVCVGVSVCRARSDGYSGGQQERSLIDVFSGVGLCNRMRMYCTQHIQLTTLSKQVIPPLTSTRAFTQEIFLQEIRRRRVSLRITSRLNVARGKYIRQRNRQRNRQTDGLIQTD